MAKSKSGGLAAVLQAADQKKYQLKPGESRSPGEGLAVVRYQTTQTNNPKSGNTKHTVPIYGPVQSQAPAKAAAPAPAPAAAPAPAPAPAPPPSQPSASVVEARQRAQEVAYSPEKQPKLFPDGTPDPYDSTGQVARGGNDQGAWNAEYSIAQKNIGDMAAENFDRQLADFGSKLPNAPKPDDSMAGALAVVQRYKDMFG